MGLLKESSSYFASEACLVGVFHTVEMMVLSRATKNMLRKTETSTMIVLVLESLGSEPSSLLELLSVTTSLGVFASFVIGESGGFPAVGLVL